MSILSNEQLLKVLSVFSERSLEGILKKTVDLIPAVFNWKGCSIFLYDEYEDVIRLVRTSGLSAIGDEDEEEMTYKRNEGLTGWVFNQQEPLLIRDLDKKDNEALKRMDMQLKWKGKFSESDGQKSKSFMAVPMKSQKGEFIGVIRSASDTKNFTKADLDVFTLLARFVSMAIENNQLLRKETRKSSYLELLMKVGTQILSITDLSALLDFVAENTAKTISSETCEIHLQKRENKNILVLKGGYGIPKDLINVAEHRVGEGLTGTIVKESRTIRSKNVLLLPEYKGKYRNAIKSHLKFGDRLTFMGMPIKVQGQPIGAIKLYNKISNADTGRYFSEDDERYLHILVDMISVAIENVRYVDTMKLTAVKSMKSQRLTALGTLAMRIPNDVVNPLTEAQLGLGNLITKINKNGIEAVSNDILTRLTRINNNLKNVASEVRILQEFSTKAGFIHVKRTWQELLDESILFMTNDLSTKKVTVNRSRRHEMEIPEITVDPNEILEVLVSLISVILYRFEHYGSKLTIQTKCEDNTMTTTIIGEDNKEGTAITRKSMDEILGESKDYSPYQFSLDVIKEIVRSNYNGNIIYHDSEEFSRVVLEIPLERK